MKPDTDTAQSLLELPRIRQVTPAHVVRWARLGWNDFIGTGLPSLLHGLIVFIASVAIVEISFLYSPVLPGAVSDFVLVGPTLATGLYALSRRLEQCEAPRFSDAVAAWRQGSRCL